MQTGCVARETGYRYGYSDGYIQAAIDFFDALKRGRLGSGAAYDALEDFWDEKLGDWFKGEHNGDVQMPPQINITSSRKPLSDKDRRLLLARYNGACGLCGEPITEREWHVDHIVPKSRGGGDEWTNLQPTHTACNLKKGNRIEDV